MLLREYTMGKRVSARGLLGEGESGRVKGHLGAGKWERQTDRETRQKSQERGL